MVRLRASDLTVSYVERLEECREVHVGWWRGKHAGLLSLAEVVKGEGAESKTHLEAQRPLRRVEISCAAFKIYFSWKQGGPLRRFWEVRRGLTFSACGRSECALMVHSLPESRALELGLTLEP